MGRMHGGGSHTAEEIVPSNEVGAQGQDDHGEGEGKEFGYHGTRRSFLLARVLPE